MPPPRLYLFFVLEKICRPSGFAVEIHLFLSGLPRPWLCALPFRLPVLRGRRRKARRTRSLSLLRSLRSRRSPACGVRLGRSLAPRRQEIWPYHPATLLDASKRSPLIQLTLPATQCLSAARRA